MNSLDQDKLLTLMHISDSGFPSGGFAHSWGLEYAIEKRWIYDYTTLTEWTEEAAAHSLIPLDGRGVVKAWKLAAENDYAGLLKLDEDLGCYRSSLYQREGAAQVGRSFLKTVASVYEVTEILTLNHSVREMQSLTSIQHPVAWGAVSRWLKIPKEETLNVYLFSTIRQWANVAVRTIPMGQTDANRYIGEMNQFLSGMNLAEEGEKEELETICPALEIAGTGHQHMKAKYFRS